MAERDLGSTFLLPHTHLYKPDRVNLIFFPLRLDVFVYVFFGFREVIFRDSNPYSDVPYKRTVSVLTEKCSKDCCSYC